MYNNSLRPMIIKRYSNRKLYDTGVSKYTTLQKVYDAVKSGRHITVVDNESSKDITLETLLMSLSEVGRKDFSTDEVIDFIQNFNV
jgi:polyhydroxyalkanoate synthesis repressor PhaR